MIPDADSYFHLAVAREFATGGYMEALPWARFSIVGETFGDKDLLFHALLMPFTRRDAATGGRLALALLNATVAGAMTLFATRALGWWSLVVPVWLYVAAPMMTFRLIRLRPEILALLLIIAVIHLAAAKRYVGVAIVAAVFALSYTAFHVVVGLSVFFFLFTIREREWKLPLAAILGVSSGLFAHPGFPHNLRVWWINNVLLFLEKSRLDVGSEFRPPSPEFLFLSNLGWWAGIALLWAVSRRAPMDRRRVAFFAIGAAVFAILTVAMQRMGVHFVPLLTIVVLERISTRPPKRIAPVALALLASALLSAPETLHMYRDLMQDTGQELTYERDYAELGKRVPNGAKVAAHWGTAEFYTFWAPQGRYLNVLDPIFMALPHPQVYAAQRRLFEGRDVDVPYTVHHTLDSDFIGFNAATPLYDRVANDPRIVPLYVGFSFLGRIAPERARLFVRDWRLPDGRRHPLPDGAAAYIDARKLSDHRCVVLLHDERVDAQATRVYEFTPYGSAELRIGSTFRVTTSVPPKAILGRGTMARVTLAPGIHRFAVRTCADESGQNGFYLLKR